MLALPPPLVLAPGGRLASIDERPSEGTPHQGRDTRGTLWHTHAHTAPSLEFKPTLAAVATVASPAAAADPRQRLSLQQQILRMRRALEDAAAQTTAFSCPASTVASGFHSGTGAPSTPERLVCERKFAPRTGVALPPRDASGSARDLRPLGGVAFNDAGALWRTRSAPPMVRRVISDGQLGGSGAVIPATSSSASSSVSAAAMLEARARATSSGDGAGPAGAAAAAGGPAGAAGVASAPRLESALHDDLVPIAALPRDAGAEWPSTPSSAAVEIAAANRMLRGDDRVEDDALAVVGAFGEVLDVVGSESFESAQTKEAQRLARLARLRDSERERWARIKENRKDIDERLLRESQWEFQAAARREARRERKEAAKLGECSVCLEGYEKVKDNHKLVCGHGFHIACLTQWCESRRFNPTCPLCRADMSDDPIARSVMNAGALASPFAYDHVGVEVDPALFDFDSGDDSDGDWF